MAGSIKIVQKSQVVKPSVLGEPTAGRAFPRTAAPPLLQEPSDSPHLLHSPYRAGKYCGILVGPTRTSNLAILKGKMVDVLETLKGTLQAPASAVRRKGPPGRTPASGTNTHLRGQRKLLATAEHTTQSPVLGMCGHHFDNLSTGNQQQHPNATQRTREARRH